MSDVPEIFPYVALAIAAFGCAWYGWRIAVSATTGGKGWFLAFIVFLLVVASPKTGEFGQKIAGSPVLGIAALIALGGFIFGITRGWRTPETEINTKNMVARILGAVVVYVIGHEVFKFGIAEASLSALIASAALGYLGYRG